MNTEHTPLYSHCDKHGNWTNWLTYTEYMTHYRYSRGPPNYRLISPNELVYETDKFPRVKNIEITMYAAQLLKEQRISFELWDSGNKSAHLHTRWAELPQQNDKRKFVAEAISRKYMNKILTDCWDRSNWPVKRMIGIEDQPHRKTGKKKTLIQKYGDWINVVPPEIMDATTKFHKPTIYEFPKVGGSLGDCAICIMALTVPFPDGTGRHMELLPNVAALAPTPEQAAQIERTQGQNPGQVDSWRKVRESFNCVQLQRYARSIGKGNVCDQCLLNGGFRYANNKKIAE